MLNASPAWLNIWRASEAENHLTREDRVLWLARLDEEHDNLRAALDRAVRTGDAETGLRTAAAIWRFWLRLVEECRGIRDFKLAADKRASLRGQIGKAGSKTPDRRKHVGKTFDQELMEMLGLFDVLQAVGAQIVELNTLGKRVLYQRARRVRHQDLSAVAGRSDPGGALDVEPNVVAVTQSALAGVNAHPDSHDLVFRPRVVQEVSLSLNRGE